MVDFLQGRSTDGLIRDVLARDVSKFGVSRIPFYFGSTKSTGLKPSELIGKKETKIGTDKTDFFTVETPTGGFYKALTKMIKLRVNPNQLTLTPYIRFSEARTNAGRIYYHWVNEEGGAVDLYELSMSGSTGSLLPGNAEAKQKLYLWMKLRELSYEPRVFKDTILVEEKKPLPFNQVSITVTEEEVDVKNEFFILLKTVSLPTLIMFTGFFKTPIVITENADNQYSNDWTFTFGITDVYPKIETLSKTVMITLLPQLLDKVFNGEVFS